MKKFSRATLFLGVMASALIAPAAAQAAPTYDQSTSAAITQDYAHPSEDIHIQPYGFWGDVGKGATQGAIGGCVAGLPEAGIGCGPGAAVGGAGGALAGAAGWAWDKAFG